MGGVTYSLEKRNEAGFGFFQSQYGVIFSFLQRYIILKSIYLHPSQAKIITWNDQSTPKIFIL